MNELIDNLVNRRASERYSIERVMRWRLRTKQSREAPAAGRTLNIISTGVLFSTQTSIAQGSVVEVAITWPVPTEAGTELQLFARGRVTRSQNGIAAVHFQQREFRPRHAQL